jgi:hypothetical protein
MATPTPEELDRQLDEFIDKIVEDKDRLPTAELDDKFWKVRIIMNYYSILYLYIRI